MNQPVTLTGHFDGTAIRLDEPFAIPKDSRVLVTLLSDDVDVGDAAWTQLGLAGLVRAYGDDEPDYSVADVVT